MNTWARRQCLTAYVKCTEEQFVMHQLVRVRGVLLFPYAAWGVAFAAECSAVTAELANEFDSPRLGNRRASAGTLARCGE